MPKHLDESGVPVEINRTPLESLPVNYGRIAERGHDWGSATDQEIISTDRAQMIQADWAYGGPLYVYIQHGRVKSSGMSLDYNANFDSRDWDFDRSAGSKVPLVNDARLLDGNGIPSITGRLHAGHLTLTRWPHGMLGYIEVYTAWGYLRANMTTEPGTAFALLMAPGYQHGSMNIQRWE